MLLVLPSAASRGVVLTAEGGGLSVVGDGLSGTVRADLP